MIQKFDEIYQTRSVDKNTTFSQIVANSDNPKHHEQCEIDNSTWQSTNDRMNT